jgi:hypothetical protein
MGPLGPARAQADEPPGAAPGSQPDDVVVYLADGRVLRGKFVDVTAGVGVQVRVAVSTSEGEVVTIPRQDVMRFERTPSTGPVSSGPHLSKPDGPRSGGWVHLEAQDGAILQRVGTGGAWVSVCATPCDRALPVDGVYRIDGSDLKASTPFALSVKPGEYESLRVSGASRGAFTAGIVTLAVGPAIGIGVTLAIVGGNLASDSGGVHGTERTVMDLSLGAAAVSVVVGIGLLVFNASTGVSQDVVAPNTRPEPEATRRPAWNEAGAAATVAAPAFTVPLVAGAF